MFLTLRQMPALTVAAFRYRRFVVEVALMSNSYKNSDREQVSDEHNATIVSKKVCTETRALSAARARRAYCCAWLPNLKNAVTFNLSASSLFPALTDEHFTLNDYKTFDFLALSNLVMLVKTIILNTRWLYKQFTAQIAMYNMKCIAWPQIASLSASTNACLWGT